MRLSVRHSTVYQFDAPMRFVTQSHRLTPVSTGCQQVRDWAVSAEGAPAAAGVLKTDFRNPLGKVAWQAACHQRVQNIGPKTKQVLELVPDTEVVAIERCSGHDGTYGVKRATYPLARKIARPVEQRVAQAGADHFTSDCVMAGAHIAHGLDGGKGEGAGARIDAAHPVSLLRQAYGI